MPPLIKKTNVKTLWKNNIVYLNYLTYMVDVISLCTWRCVVHWIFFSSDIFLNCFECCPTETRNVKLFNDVMQAYSSETSCTLLITIISPAYVTYPYWNIYLITLYATTLASDVSGCVNEPLIFHRGHMKASEANNLCRTVGKCVRQIEYNWTVSATGAV